MKYDKADYAKERLSNTVIRINNKVVYVSHREGWNYEVYDLKSRETEVVDLRKADVDLNPVPLGYINKGGSAYYTTRRPVRRWKQGLDQEALRVIVGDNDVRHAMVMGLLTSTSIVDCIENKYPSINKAVTSIAKGGCSSMAFCRSFAIGNLKGKRGTYTLLYKGTGVGLVTKKGVDLSSKYSYLKESIEEVLK